jgi:chromosome segregation ATPase
VIKENEEAKLTAAKTRRAEVLRQIEENQAELMDICVERCDLAAQLIEVIADLASAHGDYLQAQLVLIEAKSELKWFEQKNIDIERTLKEKETEYEKVKAEHVEERKQAKIHLKDVDTLQRSPDMTPELADFCQWAEQISSTELEADLESEVLKLETYHIGNGDVLKDFRDREDKLEKIKDRIQRESATLETGTAEIAALQEQFEPTVDTIVKRISSSFEANFHRIKCTGEVSVHKPELEFADWAIHIRVKFREQDELQLLDEQRQSGGERAVSTAFYLMALQSLARLPFRVVDEINQGMDPRNERVVYERMVEIACEESRSQYFLITPKLLHGLNYHPRMTVHIIASGEHMPEDRRLVDFELALRKRMMIAATAS